MVNCRMFSTIGLFAVVVSVLVVSPVPPTLHSQSAVPKQSGDSQNGNNGDWWVSHDKWNTPLPDKSVYKDKKPAPAPPRDLSGTWDGLAEGGTQAKGPKEFPDDASHKPDPPYSAVGKAARMRNKAGEGEEQVAVGDVNDPVDSCDPLGFPRSASRRRAVHITHRARPVHTRCPSLPVQSVLFPLPPRR